MISKAKETARWAATVVLVLITITTVLALHCSRVGCTRTLLGRWLVDQGGVLAAVVQGVESFWLVVALFALLLVVLDGLRD